MTSSLATLSLYYIKQTDSMLPCVCSVIDHRRRQNVVRTSVTHLSNSSCATFLFLPYSNIIFDLLLKRHMATWNLFVKWIRSMVKRGMTCSSYHVVITHRVKTWDVEFSELVEFSLLTRAERPKATSFLRINAQELQR